MVKTDKEYNLEDGRVEKNMAMKVEEMVGGGDSNTNGTESAGGTEEEELAAL